MTDEARRDTLIVLLGEYLARIGKRRKPGQKSSNEIYAEIEALVPAAEVSTIIHHGGDVSIGVMVDRMLAARPIILSDRSAEPIQDARIVLRRSRRRS